MLAPTERVIDVEGEEVTQELCLSEAEPLVCPECGYLAYIDDIVDDDDVVDDVVGERDE
jgi:hypothetical protein